MYYAQLSAEGAKGWEFSSYRHGCIESESRVTHIRSAGRISRPPGPDPHLGSMGAWLALATGAVS